MVISILIILIIKLLSKMVANLLLATLHEIANITALTLFFTL